MILQTVAGPQQVSDGAPANTRAGRLGDVIMSELHGRFYETNARGNVYSGYTSAYTIVATTDISPLPANTGVPIFGILNPTGSGKNISLISTVFTTTSGTPGGPLWWNFIAGPTGITAATNFTPVNMLTFQSSGSVAKCYSGTAIAGSSAGVALRPLGGPAASAVGAGNYTVYEEEAGALIIAPGNFLGLAATAAGTNHIISVGITWEEIIP
jgi:hypothetical protein